MKQIGLDELALIDLVRQRAERRHVVVKERQVSADPELCQRRMLGVKPEITGFDVSDTRPDVVSLVVSKTIQSGSDT